MSGPIDGVVLTTLRQITDERGAVLHMLRAGAEGFRGFGECYFSEIRPRVLKAWKRHSRQTQNLVVPIGRVRFVIADTREQSPTRGALQVYELGRPDAYVRLTIPPMLWYGFACLSDSAALVTNCADIAHEAGESETLALESFFDSRALPLLQAGLKAP
ncbi:MAG TPA: dTDP-4-dehydrorhamnose 3,5-epimerase family protein [Steroidobacteraceae bacterium]|nr:dTDP-4-dehydrorhamnose 3,5-epimerase family protein [Steroidobacteraceae bacterium]